MNFRDFWRKLRSYDQAFTIAFNVIVLIIVAISIFSFIQMKNAGTDGFLDTFGYQPVYIKTGSMEPAIKTKSIIITKRVDSMDDIAIDDVVTYVVYDATGKEIRITHRIYNIKEDGTIITKGDNNRVADSYSLTIDNIKAKVIHIWNWAADFQNMLGTTSGKVIVGCVAGIFVVLLWLWGQFVKYLDEKYGVNDDVEESVNDKLNAIDDDYEDEDDDEEEDSEKKSKATASIGNFKWQDIYEYTVNNENLITIKGIKAKYKPAIDLLDEVVVPKQLFHKKVVGIGTFAFRDCKASIINLPDTLEFIDKAAFYNCKNLIYVEMPIAVKSIGANAFDGCVSLIDIKLPVNLTRIEDKTFKDCIGLNSVTINDKVTFIGDSAFLNCNNLSTIYGAKFVNTIKLNAFKVSGDCEIETNIVTDNQYMIDYNWTYFGRRANINNSTELLEAINSDNDKMYEDLKALEELRATQKDMPEKIYEAVKNVKIPSLPKKKDKKETAPAEKTAEPIADNGMPELVLDLEKKEEDNTDVIIEKMEEIDKSLNTVKDIVEAQLIEEGQTSTEVIPNKN